MEVFGEVAEVYRAFAADTAGESPCFEDWARAVAADRDVCAWLEELPEPKRQPNLVFAAARWHGVAAPGPYDGLRTTLLEDAGDVRRTILTRSTQTNEVRRLATLAPAFAALGSELPLIEVGASAGLCLFPDRYDYAWTTETAEHVLSGSGGPRLTAQAAGPMPVPDRRIEVTWRAGIDLNPLDVSDRGQMAWLENLVWPEQEGRRRLLEAAIEVTRTQPPRILPGDLLDLLPALVAEAPGTPVVFHSAVIAYLAEERRTTFAAMMRDLVSTGACHWVSNEGPRVVPGVRIPDAVEPGPGRFLLCIDGTPVAWTRGHGQAVRWL
jgi:hypothetical protein